MADSGYTFLGQPTGTTAGTVATGNHTHTPSAPTTIFNSLRYYGPPGGRTTAAQTQSQSYYTPLWVGETVTIDRLGIEITSASGVTAGHVTRLGIYADTGNGLPGTLLLDAGTVASDTAAAVEATINLTLTPGLVWLSATPQGAGTQPTYRCLTGTAPVYPVGAITLSSGTAQTQVCAYTQQSVTGALPATATVSATVLQAGILVVVRAASGQ